MPACVSTTHSKYYAKVPAADPVLIDSTAKVQQQQTLLNVLADVAMAQALLHNGAWGTVLLAANTSLINEE